MNPYEVDNDAPTTTGFVPASQPMNSLAPVGVMESGGVTPDFAVGAVPVQQGESSGRNVGDYYDLRITADEIRSKGKDQAQVDALKRIQIRATAKAAAEVGLGTVKEFGAGACVGLAAIGFANSWNPFGWGCLLLGGGLALWGAYDFYQASQIWKAATAAQATYGNPDNVVP